MSSDAAVPLYRSMLVGIPLCLLVNASAIYAVVESPLGSLGFFDDTPTTSDWLLPMASGAAVGLLQVVAFGKRVTLIANGVTLLVGFMSFVFIFPAGHFSVGCAFVVGVVALLGRWVPGRQLGLVPIGVLIAVCASAIVYGGVDHNLEELPTLQVIYSPDGPAVLVDVDERIKSTTVTGTLADVDGCLGLVDASMGDGTILIVWRAGTEVSSDPFTLNANGESHVLGDKVSVPGAGLLTLYRDLEAYRPDMPASCYGHDLFL